MARSKTWFVNHIQLHGAVCHEKVIVPLIGEKFQSLHETRGFKCNQARS